MNVDLDNSEIGYLELNGSGEIVRPVTRDQHNEEDNEFMREMYRLAQAFVGAAAACATLGR